jgi:hypothetical protein
MTKGSSKESILEHKKVISELMNVVVIELLNRAAVHDNAKMEEPELSLFDEYTPKLATSIYGSDEYKQFLKELHPALEHHYARYRHHPEHFSDGCKGMNLLDIIEMLVDWKASSLRHNDGNILKSIEINKDRFLLNQVTLYDILKNSVALFEDYNNV